MKKAYEKLSKCYEAVSKKIKFKPEVAIVLGSGLGDFADEIQIEEVLDYHEIEGFPISTVDSHKGRYVFGYVGKVPVVIMQGRVHYYEGYDIQDVVLPIRLMKMMGAEILFLTNAAGGLNTEFQVGDFMMITDQISNFVPSPIIGTNISEWGIRFPAMDDLYDKGLQKIIVGTAKNGNIPLQKGVYVQLTGPNFETPSEVRMCQILGGDAVGMSTAVEAIAAKHMGMKVCGISCISNMGCGLSDKPLSHQEVGETTNRVAPMFKQLLKESIQNMEKGLE